jgi:LysM repeat protein
VQTIKTAVVVVLLLGVCYGAYVALNAPEPVLPPELEAWSSESDGLDLAIEEGAAVSIDIPQLESKATGEPGSLAPPSLSLGTPDSAAQPGADSLGTAPSLSLPPPSPLNSSPSNSGASLPGASLPRADADKPTAGQLASVGLHGGAATTPGLDVPPDLEGTSVPLPGAEGSVPKPKALTSTTAPEAGSLPGFPDASLPNGEASGGKSSEAGANLPAPPLPGSSVSSGGSDAAAGAAASSAAETGKSDSQTPKPTQPFKVAREEALKLANAGKLREALAKMSMYYNHIELTHDEHLDLIDLLDALAAQVIYSKRHLLEPPFTVSPGETLEGLANRFHISPEVLARINLMGESKVVLAGTQLKVLNGPFRGDVNLTRGELTLFLGDLYAGRFPISIGKDPAPSEGTYQIVDRRRDRTYYGANSQILPATDPRNPYGGYWMSLGQDLCIHGSPSSAAPELASAGCISLAPLDAREVYSLLTQGSQVSIHR